MPDGPVTDTELANLLEMAKLLQEDDDWTEAYPVWEELFVQSGKLVSIIEELMLQRKGSSYHHGCKGEGNEQATDRD